MTTEKQAKPEYMCTICKKDMTASEVFKHKSLTICEGSHPQVFAELRRTRLIK